MNAFALRHVVDPGGMHEITAHDISGKKLGHLHFGDDGVAMSVLVNTPHRRKGIATAMYQHASKILGKPMQPAEEQTPDARALWNHLAKSPYGPTGMGLYSDADNARRKMNRASLSATKPTVSQQASQLAAADKARSKKNPVKIYTQAEINHHFRGGFKRPKAA